MWKYLKRRRKYKMERVKRKKKKKEYILNLVERRREEEKLEEDFERKASERLSSQYCSHLDLLFFASPSPGLGYSDFCAIVLPVIFIWINRHGSDGILSIQILLRLQWLSEKFMDSYCKSDSWLHFDLLFSLTYINFFKYFFYFICFTVLKY